MSNSNQVTPITENEAAESLLSLINATSKAPQLPFENVSKKDKPAALNRGQENTNGASILVNQVSPNHRIQSADDPNPPRPSSPPRSPSQSEAKILNMSFLKRPASIPSRVIYQNNQTDEASSIDSNASSRRNRAFEHGKVLPSSKKGSAITTTPDAARRAFASRPHPGSMRCCPR